MDRRRGCETTGSETGGYRVFRIVARLRERTWIAQLQAYSCEQALKKFHETQRDLPFSKMASVVIIQERDLPR